MVRIIRYSLLVFMVMGFVHLCVPKMAQAWQGERSLYTTALMQTQSYNDGLLQQYVERQQQMKRNKYVLLGWGAANMLSGALLIGSDYQDFGVMNASWGAINTGIAIFALRDSRSRADSAPSHWQMLRDEQQFNRIVALNTGLDVGYMIAGLAMMQEGNSSMIRQYGTSVLVQGAFLFAYDLFLMVESTRYLNRITVEPSPMGIGIRIDI